MISWENQTVFCNVQGQEQVFAFRQVIVIYECDGDLFSLFANDTEAAYWSSGCGMLYVTILSQYWYLWRKHWTASYTSRTLLNLFCYHSCNRQMCLIQQHNLSLLFNMMFNLAWVTLNFQKCIESLEMLTLPRYKNACSVTVMLNIVILLKK